MQNKGIKEAILPHYGAQLKSEQKVDLVEKFIAVAEQQNVWIKS